MTDGEPLRVSPALAIPRDELVLRASRSSGPGGQHVNRSSTRMELVWNVATSPALDEAARARLLSRLANRLDSEGCLRLVAQEERSQLRNREAVIARFVDVVSRALVVPKKRRPTKPTHASKETRLREKKLRSRIKRDRHTRDDD